MGAPRKKKRTPCTCRVMIHIMMRLTRFLEELIGRGNRMNHDNAEILLLRRNKMVRGQVICQKHDADGWRTVPGGKITGSHVRIIYHLKMIDKTLNVKDQKIIRIFSFKCSAILGDSTSK